MNSQKQKAFTLVELIVVITILAILSTIGFVSYSSYLAGSRDTNRISQIKAISEWLYLYSTNHSLPTPDDKVDILSNTTVIAYQWYAWSNVLETITYSTEWVDPKDKTYFSYYLTKDKKHFQLMSFLEEEVNLQTTINAIDYSKRYPTVYWKKLWILTDLTNTPIQETWITSLDISLTSTEYKAYFKDSEDILQWTWSILAWISPKASCKRLYDIGWIREDWTYKINPDWTWEIEVYCDMTTDWGGWTLVYHSITNDVDRVLLDDEDWNSWPDNDFSRLWSMRNIRVWSQFEFRIFNDYWVNIQFTQDNRYDEDPDPFNNDPSYNNFKYINWNYIFNANTWWKWLALWTYWNWSMLSSCSLSAWYEGNSWWNCIQDQTTWFWVWPWSYSTFSNEITIYQR